MLETYICSKTRYVEAVLLLLLTFTLLSWIGSGHDINERSHARFLWMVFTHAPIPREEVGQQQQCSQC